MSYSPGLACVSMTDMRCISVRFFLPWSSAEAQWLVRGPCDGLLLHCNAMVGRAAAIRQVRASTPNE